MKPLMSIALVAAFLSTVTNKCLGTVIVSLNKPGSTTLHEIDVAPGETFTLDVNVNADQTVGWVRLAVSAGTSNVFDITQVIDTVPWSSQGTVFSMLGGIDPVSGTVAFTSLTGGFVPDPSKLATLQLAVDAACPVGSYTLDTTEILWTANPVIPEGGPGTPGASFVVNVVPEPASLSLILSLALFLAFPVQRKCP